MLIYPDWYERPSCRDILSRFEEWALTWEEVTKNYSIADIRSIFINFTENEFLYKFLSVKTGKGFEKIILNKLDPTTTKVGKKQISSVYRSNSVSKHWKYDKESGASTKSKNGASQAQDNLNIGSNQADLNKIAEKNGKD